MALSEGLAVFSRVTGVALGAEQERRVTVLTIEGKG